MPIVADFAVANPQTRLLRKGTLDLRFTAEPSGRILQGLIDLELLGGFLQGDQAMSVSLKLNAIHLSSPIVSRWAMPELVEMSRKTIAVPTGCLKGGANSLEICPRYESPSDYVFVGTVAVHFRREI